MPRRLKSVPVPKFQFSWRRFWHDADYFTAIFIPLFWIGIAGVITNIIAAYVAAGGGDQYDVLASAWSIVGICLAVPAVLIILMGIAYGLYRLGRKAYYAATEEY